LSKYKDINKLYNIIQIEDEYILVNYKGIDTKIYIYKIEPIVMLGLSENEKENILTVYKEFFKQINFDFQILILNSKLNVDKYIEKLIAKTNIYQVENIDLKNKYINDIKQKLLREKIYESDYYIIISLSYNSNLDIYSIDNVIKKLNKIGCNTKKIFGKNKLEKIMYRCINKEKGWEKNIEYLQ